MSRSEIMEKMDCHNCTYAKLDCMDPDPEVYKRTDELKLLIEPQTPPSEKVPYNYATKHSVKKIRKKKRVLSTLDILISIFIVTPCVVGCWRGIWQIMDIYGVYFPAWESFSLGMATHVVLALGQDVFHHVVVEKESKNPVLKLFAWFLMKFYTTTFNVISNMIWRAGWIIFDRFCGLQTSHTGQVLREGSSTAIWFTIVCIMLLICLKGLKNTMSAPFSIALDCKDEVFLFSTRYIYKGAYFIAMLLITRPSSSTMNNPIEAEKLVSFPTMQIASIKQQPRPFGTNTLGLPPHQFTPTTTTTTPTTIKTPYLNYPQLNNYRSSYQPKSIQEILAHINRHGSYNMEMQEASRERQITNQEGFDKLDSSGFVDADLFHPFKPSDPSEINLMATASFRFAPPAWKNFRKIYQQQTQPNAQQVETSNIQEIFRNFAKPFVVNLNIYPMKDQYPGSVNRFDQRLFSQRIQGGVPYKVHGDPRSIFLGDKGQKITIRLNVFPETVTSLDQEERVAESTANKVKFV